MTRKTRILTAISLLLGTAGLVLALETMPATAPASQPEPLLRQEVKMPGGATRWWLTHEPKGWDGKTKLPMVICLHGATDNAAYAADAYGWVAKADKEKFLAIFPEGLPATLTILPDDGRRYWDPGYMNPAEETDDLRFLVKMIAQLEAKYAVDASRVYVAGHSNGAVMAYMLGVRYPKKIAGLGIVAGTIGVQDQNRKLSVVPFPDSPVPVIIFHGREDTNLPYDPPDPPAKLAGQEETGEPVYQMIGVPATVRFWQKANNCPGKPEVSTSADGEVTRESYLPEKGDAGAPITLVTLKHGNHMWPGGKEMPGKTQKPSAAADATAEMWAFWGNARK